MYKKGVFTVSMDTELAWGTIDKPDSNKKNHKLYLETRNIIDEILELYNEFNISSTWAIVGHLFLEECNKKDGIKHLNFTRTNYEHYDNDWFKLDPATNIKENQLWYGKDIVEMINQCSVKQEIASHSFAHILYGDSQTKKETIESDLDEIVKVTNKYGIKLKSFVFPRNQVGFIEELKKYGFESYRGIEPSWYKNSSGYLKKFAHMIDQIFSITPPVVMPELVNGLVNIPASMLYLSMQGFRKHIPLKSRINKAKKGLDKAVAENKIFHLWFHPFNLASNPEKMLEGLREIIIYADELRNNNLLDIKTMGEISNDYLISLGNH